MVAGKGGDAATRAKGNKAKTEKPTKEQAAEFTKFQWQWLSVYLVVMLADWLQGTHMYTLYSTYGQTPGTLFAIGFTSSAVFGTFLGLYVDKYGRRLGWYSVYLLYWYKSTNTDAEGAAASPSAC
jgi:MFS family permease